jgi:beta-lactamase superfamily II metal-dependent hydrolase
MRRRLSVLLSIVLLAAAIAPARPLVIYFIDVEGGQSTLVVTPRGQTLLIDAGFPGAGTFQSASGDPRVARDPQRILAAARDAGITTIDNLLVTHFHADHDGGVPELSQLIPIRTFIDHGTVPAKADENVRGTLAAFDAYARVRARAKHREPKPGERLRLKDLDARVVSTAGISIARPLSGAASPNATCSPSALPAEEPNENPRSTGLLLQFGRFRFLDLGDLTGEPLFNLVCPRNLIGPVDVYLVAHHGGVDAADPATFAALAPRAAIFNNGPRKGGHANTLKAARAAIGADDIWQLHRSEIAPSENASQSRIANLDTSTAHWIKIRASRDGAFDVTNGRTGDTKSYPARRQ